MTLPWWLAGHDWSQIELVLRRVESPDRQQFEYADADIVSRLLRNRYITGEIESTVIGHNGPITLELAASGLTDLGRNLLTEFAKNVGP